MNIILFLLNPILGFLKSLKNINTIQSMIVFIGLYALFGYCNNFSISTSDIYRHASTFVTINQFDVFSAYKQGKLTDPYMWFVMMFIRNFTANPKIMFMVFAGIYGVFSYFLFKIAYSRYNGPRDKYFYILVFYLFCNFSLVSITGIRFYTASALFLWCALVILIQKKLVGFIGIAALPFIHFGFIYVSIIFTLFYLSNRYIYTPVLFYAFIITFCLSWFSFGEYANDFINAYNVVDNDMIESKFNSYTSTGNTDLIINTPQTLYSELNSLFWTITDIVTRCGVFIIGFVLYYKVKEDQQNLSKIDIRLLKFILLFASCSFLSLIATRSGMRYITILFEFILVFIMGLCAYSKIDSIIRNHLFKALLFVTCFGKIAFFFFNAPRMVESYFWYAPVPIDILNGLNFTFNLID